MLILQNSNTVINAINNIYMIYNNLLILNLNLDPLIIFQVIKLYYYLNIYFIIIYIGL